MEELFIKFKGNVSFFLETPDRMSIDLLKQKLQATGTIPGLSDWQKNLVLLRRCQDIDRTVFEHRVQALHQEIEKLFNESLPESMDEETYLMCQEYYDASSEMLELYLDGLEALLDWAEISDNNFLKEAEKKFEKGDSLAPQVLILSFEAEKSLLETGKELLNSVQDHP